MEFGPPPIEDLRDRFGDSWRLGQRPKIEDELNEVDAEARQALFEALLRVEIEARRFLDECPSAPEYLERFPDRAGTIIEAFDADPTASKSTISGIGSTQDAPTGGWSPETPRPSGDRYRDIKWHRGGGLGIVYRAFDQELERQVALKEIRPERVNEVESRERFLFEAKITGGLEHPGIVAVHSLDKDRPYYVMRFIEGQELGEVIKEFHATDWSEKTPGSRVVELHGLLSRFVVVCNTIAYAHSRKVIHRDIKPSNILLGSFGETLVIDWGLAMNVEEVGDFSRPAPSLRPSGSDSSHPTPEGSVVGTVQYMSPEQARGELDKLGPSSDVFLLGSTLYFLLTGKSPYNTIDKARDWTFTKPREVDASIPMALEAICLRAMAREPENRYGGAVSLAKDLEHWLADEPVTAHREPPIARLARWGRRHRAWVQAGAMALVIVSAVSISAAIAVNASRREANVQRDLARANYLQAERSLEAETEAKNEADIQRDLAQASTRKAEAALEAETKAKAEADRQRDRASTNFRKAVAANEELLVLSETVLGTVPKIEGQWADIAEKSLQAFAGFLDQAPDDRLLFYATIRATRVVGNIRRSLNQFKEAEDLYQKAIRLLEGRRDRHPEERQARDRLGELNFEMAETKRTRGRPAEGEPFALRSAEIAKGLRAEFPGDVRYARTEARCRYTLAQILVETGRSHEAVDLFGATLPTLSRAAKRLDDHLAQLELGMVLCSRGEAFRDDRRLVDSEDSIRASIEVIEPAVLRFGTNDDRFVLALARIELGKTLMRDPARLDAAESAFRLAIETLTAVRLQFPSRSDYRKYLACAHQGRGAVRVAASHPEAAEDDLKVSEALFDALFKEFPGMDEWEAHFGRTLVLLARVAQARNDRTEATRRLQQAESRFKASLDANPADRSVRESLDGVRADLKLLTP